MSESKRNTVAGKIATPKTGGIPAATPSTPTAPRFSEWEAIQKAIGGRISITTDAPSPQIFEGTLFTADPYLSIVAVDTSSPESSSPANGSVQPGDYHLIPISRIRSFKVLSLGSAAAAYLQIGPVDVKRLQERAQAKIEKLKEEERDKGKGVTKEAQAIFDSFKRINTPIRWHNQQMIVYDAVIITPPYHVEDCKGTKDKQEVLSRVKKVLEGERKKLKDREDKDRATPVGQRKGG